ncbi:hypothetical protein CONLIGDRAFT_668240 [Coniochaeta ligniaria NRRL 30616]|uniref:MFS general substrate transporter n=1 Tax=Coniochaeta ligniaria NRRL 30616 TaxID=1408157 RepID=A0A1J7IZ54_9PEZI|nr:hypothetical protein CONLIGDRAFT_668240 [Coniochaeta ligniaria NRRL 30616]
MDIEMMDQLRDDEANLHHPECSSDAAAWWTTFREATPPAVESTARLFGREFTPSLAVCVNAFEARDATLLAHVNFRFADSPFLQRLESTPYALRDFVVSNAALDDYFDQLLPYLLKTHFDHAGGGFITQVLETAYALAYEGGVGKPGSRMLRYALRGWAAQCTFCRHIWRLVEGGERVGAVAHPALGDYDVPRFLYWQMDCISERYAHHQETSGLRELERCMFSRKRRSWLPVVLASFIYHTVLERDTWNLESWNMKSKRWAAGQARPTPPVAAWPYVALTTPEHDPSVIGPGGDVPEELCKENPIQQKLAFYLGLLELLAGVCELLGTVPMGYLSDRVGRQFVLFINIAGTMCSYIWYIAVGRKSKPSPPFFLPLPPSSLFLSLRGASADSILARFFNVFPIEVPVIGPLLTSQRTRRKDKAPAFRCSSSPAYGNAHIPARTRIFSWALSASQVVFFVGPAVSSTALAYTLWLPFALGLSCFSLVLVLTIVLAETRPWKQQESTLTAHDSSEPGENGAGHAVSDVRTPLLADEDPVATSTDPQQMENVSPADDADPATRQQSSGPQSFVEFAKSQLSEMQRTVRGLFKLMKDSPSYLYCLSIFLITTLSRSSLNILLLYVSKRYSKTIAQVIGTPPAVGIPLIFKQLITTAGRLPVLVKAGVSLVLYFGIIPGLLRLLVARFLYTSAGANLWGLRASVILLCIGSLLVGLSSAVWALMLALIVYSLGFGLNLFALSFITDITRNLWDDAHVARTYSAVAFVEIVGGLAGVPLLTAAWVQGLQLGGYGLGLPWFVSAGLYLVSGYPAIKLHA